MVLLSFFASVYGLRGATLAISDCHYKYEVRNTIESSLIQPVPFELSSAFSLLFTWCDLQGIACFLFDFAAFVSSDSTRNTLAGEKAALSELQRRGGESDNVAS